MTCKRCGSEDVVRSRRKSLLDKLKAALGYWPYRCSKCAHRFVAPGRYLPTGLPRTQKQPTETPEQSAINMAFHSHPERPHAKILVQADSHEQLDHILLALNRAINSYERDSKARTTTPSAGAERAHTAK